MVLFPPPFYFVFDISNLLSYIKIISSYELARPDDKTYIIICICSYWVQFLCENLGMGSLLPNGSHFSIIINHTFPLDLNFYKCKKAFQQKLDIDAFNERKGERLNGLKNRRR